MFHLFVCMPVFVTWVIQFFRMGHHLDKGILHVSDGAFSTQNFQIHLSQNEGGDAMLNFLVRTEESWFYVIVVGPSKFCFEYFFWGGMK